MKLLNLWNKNIKKIAPSSSRPSPNSQPIFSSGKTLENGAIAGITIASIIGAILIGLAINEIYHKFKKK